MNIDDILNTADTDSDDGSNEGCGSTPHSMDVEALLVDSSDEDDEQYSFRAQTLMNHKSSTFLNWTAQQTVESLLRLDDVDATLGVPNLSWKLSVQQRYGRELFVETDDSSQLFSTDKLPISLESAYRHELLSQSTGQIKSTSLIVDASTSTFGLKSGILNELSLQLSKNAQVFPS